MHARVCVCVLSVRSCALTVHTTEISHFTLTSLHTHTHTHSHSHSGQPRYSIVDWNHKLLFVSFVPDTSKAMNKMKYASVKEAFIQECVGIQVKIHATDDSEINSDIIAAKTKSNV